MRISDFRRTLPGATKVVAPENITSIILPSDISEDFAPPSTQKTTLDERKCKICGAESTEDNRVNWWDRFGNVFGPLTKPEKGADPLCEPCANKAFQARQALLTQLEVIHYIPTQLKVFQEYYVLTTGEQNIDPTDIVRLVSEHVVLLACLSERIIGHLSFRLEVEPDKPKFFLHFDELLVAPHYRGKGIGTMLMENMLMTCGGRHINYLTFDKPPHSEVEQFLRRNYLTELDQSILPNCFSLEQVHVNG